MILYLEASQQVATCCLSHQGELLQFNLPSPYDQSEQFSWKDSLMKAINQATNDFGLKTKQSSHASAQTQLQSIVVGLGPGKFIAMRYAIGFALSLGWTTKKSVYGIRSDLSMMIERNRRDQHEWFKMRDPVSDTIIMYQFPVDCDHSSKLNIHSQPIDATVADTSYCDLTVNSNNSENQSLSVSACHLAAASLWSLKDISLLTLLYNGVLDQPVQSIANILHYRAQPDWVPMEAQKSMFEK